MKARTAPQGAARGALAGAYPTPAIGLPLSVGLAFWDDFAWAGDTGGGGGGGTGDFVGPASSTDLSIVQFDGTTGKLGKVAPVKITGAGAMVPDADGTQQLGNHSFTWTELWSKQVTNKVQASVQAPSPGWSTSYAAFWTKTGGLPQHTYNGTDRQLALAGANSDITSLSALSTPLSIGQGGTGQTTAAGAFNAIKQGATTSASGVAEVADYLEGQSEPGVRIEDATAAHNMFRSGFAEWGSMVASPFHNDVTGTGVLSIVGSTGTFSSGMSPTYGAHLFWSTSTTTGRGVYAGDGAGSLSWAQAGLLRYVFRFGGSGTFRIFGGLVPWGSAANMVAAETSVAPAIRVGNDGGTLRAICSDGAFRTKQDFTTTPGLTTQYEFEVVVDLAASSVRFRLYAWSITGGRGALLEPEKTITTNIPTGGTAIVPIVWSLATSGTPTAYWHSIDVVANTV